MLLQVFKTSNPELKMNNFEIMDLIIDEYKKFKEDKRNEGLGGLKVIYCTPRSFNIEKVRWSLEECLSMKQNPKIGPYIAGKHASPSSIFSPHPACLTSNHLPHRLRHYRARE